MSPDSYGSMHFTVAGAHSTKSFAIYVIYVVEW